MPATVELTVTTRVTEANPDCVGKATTSRTPIFIQLDARRQAHQKVPWPRPRRQAPSGPRRPGPMSSRAFGLSLAIRIG